MESIFLLNSSCSCAGPCIPCNSKSRTYRSGNDRSSIECFHFLDMMPNVGRDTAVSAKLMYRIMGHLWDRASMCSSFTNSPAKLIEDSVGVIR